MSRKLFLSFVLLLAAYPALYAAQEVPSERLVERPAITPAMVSERPEKGQWTVTSFYERSNVVQSSRHGHWDELTNSILYRKGDIAGYVSISKLQRFSERDYTANMGAYFKLGEYLLHEEFGWGWDVDFIYKLQNIVEVSHKLKNNLYWQFGYNYRAYIVNDTHLMYPGLMYYFGDNYIGVDYGLSVINSRGLAQYGVIKSDFAINKFLHWSLGAAIGERLYDIFGIDASKEYGYIIFTGANLNVTKDLNFRIGYSYGSENPKFIKRSLNLALSLKF